MPLAPDRSASAAEPEAHLEWQVRRLIYGLRLARARLADHGDHETVQRLGDLAGPSERWVAAQPADFGRPTAAPRH